MGLIKSAADINVLAEKEQDAGGVYFVTAFSGLLAPYWDTSAGGVLIGSSLSCCFLDTSAQLLDRRSNLQQVSLNTLILRTLRVPPSKPSHT